MLNSGLQDEQPIFLAQNSRSEFYGLLCLSLLGWIVTGAFLRISFKDIYPNFIGLMFAAACATFAILVLRAGLRKGAVAVFRDRIEIKTVRSWFDQRIYLNEVVQWYEEELEVKKKIEKKIVIRHSNGKLKINADTYSHTDYERLKTFFGEHLKSRQIDPSKFVPSHLHLAFATAIFFAFTVYVYKLWNAGPEPVTASGLKEIFGVMAEDAAITKGSKGSRSIHLPLSNYPAWTFSLDAAAFAATNRDLLLENVRAGDTVWVGIGTVDFNKKIAGITPLSIGDKIIRFRRTEVFTIRNHKGNYLTLDNYNSNLSNSNLGWLVVIGTVLLLVTGILWLDKISHG